MSTLLVFAASMLFCCLKNTKMKINLFIELKAKEKIFFMSFLKKLIWK